MLEARSRGLKYAEVSLNLNISVTKISISENLFEFPENEKVSESELSKAIKDDKSCFLIKNNSLAKMQFFSDKTNKYYKLFPTKGAPTVEISGIRMHATKNFTPWEDTKKKIDSISPLRGKVLDTCTGLGYTAILASKTADSVITFEKDENMQEIAMLNPWSEKLFNNKKICIMKADVYSGIVNFKSGIFDAVIHDPPRLSLAPELYSANFYAQIYRILKNHGRLYHYTGFPGGKSRNINLPGNVAKRLRSAGFKDVKNAHYGLTGRK